MRNCKLVLPLIVATFSVAAQAATQPGPTPLLTRPAEELVAVLQSNASQKDKVDACRELAIVGTKEAVPALAALLPDEKMNHMARYALERIPDPAVDQALRDALPSLKGRPLVGVIISIGVRKDTQAVQPLAGFLTSPEADVVQAAARALGRIATGPAAEALDTALKTTTGPNQLAVCEGLLRCAEALQAQNQRKKASPIYEHLRLTEAPAHVRVAALRGAVLTKGREGVAVLSQALSSADYVLFAAAVRISYELSRGDVTKALAMQLPKLSDDDRKLLVIEALGKRRDQTGVTTLRDVARDGSKRLRLAAIHALAEVGTPPVVPVLAELLVAPDRELSQAALDALGSLKGAQVDKTVQGLLKASDTQRRLDGIELLGRRRMTAAVPDLLKASTDPDPQIRAAALSKVGELGKPADAATVLDLLPRLSTTEDMDAAEQALSSLCSRAGEPDVCAGKLIARLESAGAAQKGVLFRVLSSVGGNNALAAVRSGVNSPNPEVRQPAIRALAAWKTADAAPDLLGLATHSSDATERTLAMRGYLGLATNPDVPAAERLQICREASTVVKSPEEKRLLLGALGGIDSPESVKIIMPYLDDPATKDEAGAAIASVAQRTLRGERAAQAAAQLIQPLQKVIETTSNENLAKRARGLLQQAEKKATR